MKKLALAAVALGLFGVAAFVYAAPYLTLDRMRAAAEARDAAELSSYVDYAELRESLKSEVNAQIAGDSGVPGGGFRALSAAFAGALVGPIIDYLVTPENLALMLRGGSPRPGSAPPPAEPSEANIEVDAGYEDASTFVASVAVRGAATPPVDFVLSRDGPFGWKLTGVRLPRVWISHPPSAENPPSGLP